MTPEHPGHETRERRGGERRVVRGFACDRKDGATLQPTLRTGTDRRRSPEDDKPRCNFCGKSKLSRVQLVQGLTNTIICDECAEKLRRICETGSSPEDVRGDDVGEADYEWLEGALDAIDEANNEPEDCGPPCICDGDNVALQVLCRAFKEDPADLMDEWRAFDKSGWIWWGRALGVFIRTKIEAAALRSPTAEPVGACPFERPVRVVEEPPVWDVMTDIDRVAICEDRATAEYIAAAINAFEGTGGTDGE